MKVHIFNSESRKENERCYRKDDKWKDQRKFNRRISTLSCYFFEIFHYGFSKFGSLLNQLVMVGTSFSVTALLNAGTKYDAAETRPKTITATISIYSVAVCPL